MRQRKKNKRHSNQFVQCFAKKFFGNLVLRSIKQCDQRRFRKKDPETGVSLEKEIKLQKVRQNHILIVVLFDWKKVELVKNLKIFLPSGKVPSDHIKSKNAETKKEKKTTFRNYLVRLFGGSGLVASGCPIGGGFYGSKWECVCVLDRTRGASINGLYAVTRRTLSKI